MTILNRFYHKYFLVNQLLINDLFDIKIFVHYFLLHLSFDHVIDISNGSILHDLFHLIHESTSFHHVTFNGLPYYEMTNIHQNMTIIDHVNPFNDKKPIEHIIRPSYDIDVVCNDSDIEEADDCGATIFPTSIDRVKYILKYKKKWMDNDYYEPKNIELLKQIFGTNFKKVLLVGFKSLKLVNRNGINHDHRGSNHCNIYLKFYPNVHITQFTSLNTLAKSFYKLKSHKWDSWYEMFSDVNFMTNINHDIVVHLNFDHGS